MVGYLQTLGTSCADDFKKAASGVDGKDMDLEDAKYADTFISSFVVPLKDMCKAIMKEDKKSSSVGKVDAFEVATRSHLLEMVKDLLAANTKKDIALVQESIQDILTFTRNVIDFCVYLSKTEKDVNSAQLKKLPFVLLEDIVETLPTSLVQIIWRFGGSYWLRNILCKNSELFHQGSKFCLIRMCNQLLKNLSVNSQDDAAHFAGEISMTLASVFPLSERSAVNVLGAFHTDAKYQVEYESIEEWMEGAKVENANGSQSTLSKEQKVALNYGFYSKFWSIQKIFTNPKDLIPKTNQKWSENTERFIMDLLDVLNAFEGNQFSPDLIKRLQSKVGSMKSINGSNANAAEDKDVEMTDATIGEQVEESSNPKRQYKYLTSSQLLHLQLKDPEIRMHFLTQLFIITSYLSKTFSDYLASPAGSNLTNKLTCDGIQTKLQDLEKRAEKLMKDIPVNGSEQFDTLKWILGERESVWKHWKSKKCTPAIEKLASSRGDEVEDLAAKRRRLMGGTLTQSESKSIKASANKYLYSISIDSELPDIAKGMAKQGSAMNQYFEEYADALDPEAGIEAEYHPKNNKLASWRALRILSKKYIGDFGDKDGLSMIQKKNGDFEGIVRKVWKDEKGEDIPGECPLAEEFSDDEVDNDSDSDKDKEMEEEVEVKDRDADNKEETKYDDAEGQGDTTKVSNEQNVEEKQDEDEAGEIIENDSEQKDSKKSEEEPTSNIDNKEPESVEKGEGENDIAQDQMRKRKRDDDDITKEVEAEKETKKGKKEDSVADKEEEDKEDHDVAKKDAGNIDNKKSTEGSKSKLDDKEVTEKDVETEVSDKKEESKPERSNDPRNDQSTQRRNNNEHGGNMRNNNNNRGRNSRNDRATQPPQQQRNDNRRFDRASQNQQRREVINESRGGGTHTRFTSPPPQMQNQHGRQGHGSGRQDMQGRHRDDRGHQQGNRQDQQGRQQGGRNDRGPPQGRRTDEPRDDRGPPSRHQQQGQNDRQQNNDRVGNRRGGNRGHDNRSGGGHGNRRGRR